MGILKGTLPALLTPYHKDGSINEKEFINYCEFGISKGLDGLFCNGSAGDSQALSVEKQIQLMKLSKEASKNNVPIITGITSSVYENTTILAQKAYEIGLDALLLAMPYYYKFNEETLFEYVKDIASKVKLPLYIYNIPLFAPPLPLTLIEKLSKIDNIVGIKDSSGDALLLNHILDIVPDGFDVFVGREEFYAGALFAGAKGSMTSAGAVFPELMSEIYKAMNEKSYEKALKIQKSLLKAIRFGMSITFPMGFALLLKARGFDFADFSPHPLSKITQEALHNRFDEAKNIIKELEEQTGIKL
ncbi:dihydrodipicolinate synthase family protein [Campylobacter insulaenigrae]|uniref:Dihydrodipicolinate synthase family protein n=1 Tax=Campylobacter insulaenigrae TaxID=260714 RepID=A0ABY3G815_9BACT|nr:dihydrodipicolinate synthase family protein [Campylobacter insulaenigrae]MCR6573649.1 dihydrodipicolinate synthase family protein [Campylobacter insulaenigrae]MCR6576673.1 dihydrodipicolinate synthase family protein [Campylobacter insulaenigrae]MCR6578689.1 dihydrodipicolinate synthase family protein [Campylobacter insulaenigrae]MCR6579677.1 dihydrodipicolinate synthase family protein [Campylobacter insulaenigrae]MCR6584630.1 dihydrodipicolinate synthase family protein [Campylobacter insula